MEIFELKGEFLRKMSDEDFFRFCRENSDLKIERNAEGKIEIMSPTGHDTGKINFLIVLQLGKWYEEYKMGEPHGPDTGFALENGAVRSPDAAWISDERLNQLQKADKKRFAHICPDFVVELKSESDSLQMLQNKLKEWIDNGCRLGWLIDPEQEAVHIYYQDGSQAKVEGFEQKLSGEDVLPGFELDLRKLRL